MNDKFIEQSILKILKSDWKYWLTGLFFIILINRFYLPGSAHSGLLPDFSVPYKYEGDGLFHLWMIQRVIEGWFYESARSGYPFGSTFLDFPGADIGSHLVLKILGVLSGESHIAFNLFYASSFLITFIVAYVVMRCIGLSIPLSLAGGVIFDFLPFHFLRLGHLFYTWYFTVPIFFYIGFKYLREDNERVNIFSKYLLLLLVLILLASFGVYYSLFGIIILISFGVGYSLESHKYKPLYKALSFSMIILFGTLINISPNLLYRNEAGINPEVAQRTAVESEVYGLKFVQLLLPRIGHRNESLSNLTNRYNEQFPLVNENSTSSLGLLGVLGLAVALFTIASKTVGHEVNKKVAIFSLVILVLFMFGTVGGFGVIFAQLITPSIRAWNRISIFIAFGTIVCLLFVIQNKISQKYTKIMLSRILWVTSIFLVTIGIYDQTSPMDVTLNDNSKKIFLYDQDFIRKIESVMPTRSAIYQIPYIGFPEVPPLNSIGPYTPLIGFIHSKSLRWSSGGMKGREGDLFFRNLSKEPIATQIEVVRKLGFAGIYVDLRGYQDNGSNILDELSVVLGNGPLLKRIDGSIVFFKINNTNDFNTHNLSTHEIMQASEYYVDKLGKRYKASLSEGIDFTRADFPAFLKNITGVSAGESWGRWSDANLDPVVTFEFNDKLPQSFMLEVDLVIFGPNRGRTMRIDIGTDIFFAELPNADGVIQIPVNLTRESNIIKFIPPVPTSPEDLKQSKDLRKLGLGFRKLTIKNK